MLMKEKSDLDLIAIIKFYFILFYFIKNKDFIIMEVDWGWEKELKREKEEKEDIERNIGVKSKRKMKVERGNKKEE